MLMRQMFSLMGVVAVFSLSGLSAVQAADGPAGPPARPSSCFLRRQWTGGWKATPDSKALYIRVSDAVYQVDLTVATPLLQSGFAVIIDKGSEDSICDPLDLRLVVTDRIGGPIPLIVSKLTKLTPDQVKALPKKERP